MSSRFERIDTPLDGLILLQRRPIADARGFLERLYCEDEIQAVHPSMRVVQANRSLTLRCGSPTFLRWHGEVLSAENHRSLFVPAGFAHGFQTLSEDCELLYFHSAAHAPAAENGLHPQDPRLGIAWPQAIAEMSARDAAHGFLQDDFEGVVV